MGCLVVDILKEVAIPVFRFITTPQSSYWVVIPCAGVVVTIATLSFLEIEVGVHMPTESFQFDQGLIVVSLFYILMY